MLTRLRYRLAVFFAVPEQARSNCLGAAIAPVAKPHAIAVAIQKVLIPRTFNPPQLTQ